MHNITAIEAMRQACVEARAAGKRVALVPTMGALHAGHMALVEQARKVADWVVVSVFVNPTQFGPDEDLQRYPRTLAADAAACRAAGVHVLFTPASEAMYPAGEQTRVRVNQLTAGLCGAFRPGHFEGVTTIVSKLFAVVGSCVAVFGRKDYQQWCVIRRMAQDLLLPIEVVGVAIVREADGLALSSRNRYLSAEQRGRALSLSRGLAAAWRAFEAGERGVGALLDVAAAELVGALDRVDYLTLADADNLQPLARQDHCGQRALLALAAHIGHTRLIDNVVLGEDPAPLPAGEVSR